MVEEAELGTSIDPQARQAALGWLKVGIGALALAGLFAILLVLARMPGMEGLFPGQDFFRVALVVHVDLSVLVWFLAFAGVVWSLTARPASRSGGRALALNTATLGCILAALAPFLASGEPLLSNYVPVLRQPWFLGGLGIFAVGVLIQVVWYLAHGGRPRLDQPLALGALTLALAALVSAGALVWSWARLAEVWQGQAYFEYLFWGSGHALQFLYTQLLLVAWLAIAQATGVPLALGARGQGGLILLGAAPLLLVPLIQIGYAPDSAEARVAFTELMRYGGGLGVVPLGLLLLWGLARRPPHQDPALLPAYRALLVSLGLFGAGGLLAWLIGGVNTLIPAHYHGSIVGVTLALMGLSYLLLPRLGYPLPSGSMARWQPLVYGAGQLLHISGLALSGALGIQRKTAGLAQGLDGWAAKGAMGIMGLGGLLAVLGGLMFVIVAIRALSRRP